MPTIIDLTDAWIDWKETCAYEKCQKKNQQDFDKVTHAVASQYMDKLGYTCSRWQEDRAAGWHGSVFCEIETSLYHHETIKGKPVKNYLLNVIATRSGGMAKNLTGYVIKDTLRSMLNAECSKLRGMEPTDEEILQSHVDQDSNSTSASAGQLLIEEEKKAAQQAIRPLFESWDDDIKLAFWCTAMKKPFTNPTVISYFRRRKSALAEAYIREVKKLKAVTQVGWGQGESFDYTLVIHDVLWPMLEEWKNTNSQYAFD